MSLLISSRSKPLRLSLMTLACLGGVGAASAQDANPPASAQPEAQRVEVTGSRLKQIDAEGVSPVQVISRETITATGATNVREALESLSAFSTSGTLSDVNGSGSFSPGASGASLRNLGKQSTLVLLNGRRIAAFPLADYSEVFSNIDTLPLDAIDRIEILKNGGSALYGSDAVAGVINIITKATFQGAQIDYSAQKSLKNGQFGERSGSLTVGVGDYNAKGWNVLANLEMYRRDELLWNRVLDDVNPAYAAHSASFGTTSTYAYPGNIIGVGPVDGCTNVVGGLCRYDRYSRFEAIPASKRINALVSGRKRVDDNTEWFAEALYSDIKSNYQGAYQAYGEALGTTIWGNPETGDPKIFYYRGLPATHPLNPTGDEVEFRYRFVDGPSYEETDTTQYRFLTGFKGLWKSYDYETAVGVMGGSTHDTQRGAFSDSGFRQVIGDYDSDPVNNPGTGALPDDFFNMPNGYKIGQPNSQAVLDTLFPTYGYTAKNQQTFWDGTIRTDLFQLPAGAVQLAAGFDLRHESMNITPSDRLRTGDIVGYGTSQSEASRNYGALFAEAGIPITKTLDGDLAARVDKFPGFAAHISPKAGLKFKPIEQALFRGTYETGFRAPNLTESAESTKFAFEPGINDPKRCDQALAYANDLTAQGDALPEGDPQQAVLYSRAQSVYDNECGRSVAERTTNNPALKPETSRSFTLGTVLQPAQRWSTSIDYWNIHRKNEINTKGAQDLLAAESSQPAGVINRQTSFDNDPTFSHDPSGLTDQQVRDKYGVVPGDYYLQQIHNQFENLFQTKTDGIDLSVKGSVPTSFGEFGLDVDATYTRSYRVYSNTLGGFGDNLAGRYGYPKWVMNTTAAYEIGSVRQSLRWVFNSRTSLKLDFDDTQWDAAGCADAGIDPQDCAVKTLNRIDYAIAYTGIKDLSVGLFIRNLFQKRPPVDYRSFGAPSGVFPPSTDDAAGRVGKIVLSYKWL